MQLWGQVSDLSRRRTSQRLVPTFETTTRSIMDLGNAPMSGKVEDRRGMGTGLAVGGGGGILLLILGLIFGPQIGGQLGGQRAGGGGGGGDQKTLDFSKKVLGTTESVWNDQFQKMGKTYR